MVKSYYEISYKRGIFENAEECNYYIMFNTRNDCQDRLRDAFNCLDPSSTYFFFGFPDRLLPTLKSYLGQFGIKANPSNLQTSIWYNTSPAEALKFNTDPPEGITLSELSQGDVETINSIWPHRHLGSEKYISRLIAFNPNIGAFDEDGLLLAWCLVLPIGALGVLHVKDRHKRNGYGSLVTRALSKRLAAMGVEITAAVVETNVASRNLFHKLGFKEIDVVHWLKKPEQKSTYQRGLHQMFTPH